MLSLKNCMHSFFPRQAHFKKVLHVLVKIHWRRSNVNLFESFLNQRIFVAADCICRCIKKYIQLDFIGLIFCGVQHFYKPVPKGVCQVVIFSFENCKALYCNICFYHRVKIGNIAHVFLICVDNSSPDFRNSGKCNNWLYCSGFDPLSATNLCYDRIISILCNEELYPHIFHFSEEIRLVFFQAE